MKSRRTRITLAVLEALGVLAVLVILMLWLAGTFHHKVQPAPPVLPGASSSVKTEAARIQTYPVLIEQVGTTRMETEAQISSRIMAQVLAVEVREGQTVSGPDASGAGATVLMRLDDRDIRAKLQQATAQAEAAQHAIEGATARQAASEAQLQAAQAHLIQAEKDYSRFQALFQKQAVTSQEVDHAKAEKDIASAQTRSAQSDIEAAKGELARSQSQKEEAEAAVAQARVSLSYSIIQAPFSGRIERKLADVGDTVNPGQALFLLETPLHPQIHTYIAESLLPRISPGQKLQVRIDTINRTLEGTVVDIIPKIDPATRTVLIKIALPSDPALVTGQFGRVSVPNGEYQAIVIPFSSVREVGQLDLVDVLDPSGRVERRFVTLGERHAELVEVLSGLKPGERVVVP